MSRLASTRRTRPADVSERPCAWRRTNSCVSSSSSRWAIAVDIDGWDILTRSDARVMLPVSAVAMKYSIWRSVYLMRRFPERRETIRNRTWFSGPHGESATVLRLARHPETGSVDGLPRAPNVVFNLRRVNGPQFMQCCDRAVAPIDPQIHDRPGDIPHHIEAGRMNRPGLSALIEAGP